MKDLAFLFDSLENLQAFPQEVKRKVGYALRFAQAGRIHEHAKKDRHQDPTEGNRTD